MQERDSEWGIVTTLTFDIVSTLNSQLQSKIGKH